MSPLKNKKERNTQITKLRKEGKSVNYLASRFGLSRQRISQILKKNEDRMGFNTSPFMDILSPAVIKALKSHYGVVFDPKVLVDDGSAKLKLVDNIGLKRLQEIANALHKLGYITDPDHWLDKKE